jgi:hypothetical protein
MRIPEPLPQGLTAGPFTVSEADASGISRGRLRHARITRLSRSIRWVDSQDLADLQSMPPHRRYRAFTQVTPYSVASHYSAAEVWEFPMPHFADDGMLHITRLTGMSPQRRGGVSGHTGQMFAGEICVVDGLSLTSRERTWLDLAQRLTVPDLTVIADHLIRIPRPEYENRTAPYATKESLQEVIDRHTGKRGIRKARLALDLSRMGADSPPETLLRLALVDAGLPEPLVNAPVPDTAGNSTISRTFPTPNTGWPWSMRARATPNPVRWNGTSAARNGSGRWAGPRFGYPGGIWPTAAGLPSTRSGQR